MKNFIKICIATLKGIEGSVMWQMLATNSEFLIPISLKPQRCRPQIFQTINSVRSKNLSLKYQRFRPSGCKDIGIRKLVSL